MRVYTLSSNVRVLSRNGFLGGKMVRGKYALGWGLEPSPQENVSVPLSKHYSSVITGSQELSQCHYLFAIGKILFGGSLSVWGRSSPVE